MVRFAFARSRSKDTEKVVLENNKLVPATSVGQKQKAFDVEFAKNLSFARDLIRGNQNRFIACFNGLCFPLNFFVNILERKIDDSRTDYFCKLFLVDDYIEILIDENTDILIVDSTNLLFCLPFQYNILAEAKYSQYIRLFTLDAKSMEFPLPLGKAFFDSVHVNFDFFVERIRTLASSNPDFSFLHLVVRVEDQKRDVPDDHKRLPAYIPDDEFHALFGSAPIEHSYYGTQCYISKPIKDFNDIRQLTFSQVIESTFLVVTIPPERPKGPLDPLCEPFVGKDLIFDPFYRFFQSVAKMSWAEILARTIHVMQSGGTGKTRLALELLEAVGVGWYCVYRDDLIKFPPFTPYKSPTSSPWMKWLIEAVGKSFSDEHSLVICLIFIEQLLANKLESKAKEFFLQKEFHNLSVCSVVNNCCNENEKIIRLIQYTRNDDYSAVAAELEKMKVKLMNSIAVLSRRYKVFPIVFDESHEMLKVPKYGSMITCHLAMERAIMALNTTCIVGIFLGSKSSLKSIKIADKIDASLRAVVPDNVKWIPPYHLNDTFDIFLNGEFVIRPDEIVEAKSIGSTRYYQSVALKAIAIKSGRPMWNRFENFDDAVDAARYRINSDKKMIDLTCFIMRTGALIAPQYELAQELVVNGLATLLHADIKSDTWLTCYFSEPVVSNTARLRMSDDERFVNGLEEFLKRLNVGTFTDTSASGALVAKLLLLKGFDRSLLKRFVSDFSFFEAAAFEFDVNGKKFACPKLGLNTAIAFLVSFTGLDEASLRGIYPNDLLDGFVAVNQFTQVNKDTVVDQVFLLNGFARATSFALWQQAPGADLIIPVMKRDGAMACIVVQAKCYSSAFPDTSYLEYSRQLSIKVMSFLKLDEQSLIRIALQFGPKPDTAAAHTNRTFTQSVGDAYKVLWLNGIEAFDHLLRSPTNDFSSSNSAKEGESLGSRRILLRFGQNHYEQIKSALYKILCNDRDYYDGIKDRTHYFLSTRQTSVDGARSLYITAAPCSDNRYSALFDAQGQTVFAGKRVELLQLFKSVGVQEKVLKSRKYSFNSRIEGQVEEVTEVQEAKEVAEEEKEVQELAEKRCSVPASNLSKKPKN